MKTVFLRQAVISVALFTMPLYGIGTSFLNVPFTPRQLALGGAGTALWGDPSLFRLNPALVVQKVPATEVFFGYNAWLAGARGHSVVAVQPFMGGTLGLGLRSLTISDLELRTARPTDDPLSSFTTSGTAVEAAWGKGNDKIRLGGTLRWLQMESYIYASTGVAFDVGAIASFLDGRLTAGASLRNSGQMLAFKEMAPSLPTTASVGLVFKPILKGSLISTIAALTVESSDAYGSVIRVGGETGVKDFTLTGGVRIGEEVTSYAGGVTFRARVISVGYGFEVASHGLGIPHLLQVQLTLP